MEFLKNFFREGTKESMTRACMLLITLNTCAFMFVYPDHYKLTLGILSLIFTVKLVQNNQENKKP